MVMRKRPGQYLNINSVFISRNINTERKISDKSIG